MTERIGPPTHCPECGYEIVKTERRPNGNSVCEKNHVFPTAQAMYGLHVDLYIWNRFVSTKDENEAYAKWMLMHFRLPAVQQSEWNPFIKGNKLFCTYKDERYRCIGASRMGDIWLTKDFDRDHGYDLRVYPNEVSNWGKTPELSETKNDQPST